MSDLSGRWVTIKGRRVFIKDGQDLSSAMKESGKFEKAKNVENALKKYASGEYEEYCQYAQYLSGTSGKHDKEWYEENILNNISDEVKEETKAIMGLIDKEKPYEKDLYRIEKGFREDIKIGDEVKYGIISTTRDKDFIEKVVSGEDSGIDMRGKKEVTCFVLQGKNQALDIDKYSSFNQSESLVKGDYKVTKIETIGKPNIQTYKVGEMPKVNPKEFEYFTNKSGTEMVRKKSTGQTWNKTNNGTFTKEGEEGYIAERRYSDFVERRMIYLEKQR